MTVLHVTLAGRTSLYGRDSECFALEECPFQGWEDFAEGNMPYAHLLDVVPWLTLETADEDVSMTKPALVAAQIHQTVLAVQASPALWLQ